MLSFDAPCLVELETSLSVTIAAGPSDASVDSNMIQGHASVNRRWGRIENLWHAASILLVALVLTACGEPETPENPAATLEPVQTAMVPSTAGTTEQGNGGNTVVADETSTAELTLGDLVDRINARLADLDAFREVSASMAPGPSPVAASAIASPPGERTQRTVREVVLPDRVRYTAELNGRFEYALIVINERVFARGSVASLLDPTAQPEEWIETETATVAKAPRFGEAAAQQLTDLAAPRYAVPDRLRPQPVRSLDPVAVNGTECNAYGAADTTASGARIDLTFAIDAEDRLCFIETEAVGISSRYTVEALDGSFSINAPVSARPIATPVATPLIGATPTGIATPVATP